MVSVYNKYISKYRYLLHSSVERCDQLHGPSGPPAVNYFFLQGEARHLCFAPGLTTFLIMTCLKVFLKLLNKITSLHGNIN